MDPTNDQTDVLAELYSEGLRHYRAKRWPEALACFSKVEDTNHQFKDVATLKATALGALYDEGLDHYRDERWHEALRCFYDVEGIDEHYSDIFDLIENAQCQIAKALADHYSFVISYLLKGDVIPFLGAGVNMCGRPRRAAFQRGCYLPNGRELAAHLVEGIEYPQDETFDLTRVSQFVEVMRDPGYLYDRLRYLFDDNYGPTLLHKFLAALPKTLCEKKSPHPYQLIVTTNYDDVLERAFHAEHEEFDLLTYVAEGADRPKFRHYPFVYDPTPRKEGQDEDEYQTQVELEREEFWSLWPPAIESQLIEDPVKYTGLSVEQRTIILKIHGAVDRANSDRDSYVITEDDYIDYLSRLNIGQLVPAAVLGMLRSKRSRFLFLGYALRDWNLRVILNNLWDGRKLARKSWAIQINPKEIDIRFWKKSDVEILDVRLEDYVRELSHRLQDGPQYTTP